MRGSCSLLYTETRALGGLIHPHLPPALSLAHFCGGWMALGWWTGGPKRSLCEAFHRWEVGIETTWTNATNTKEMLRGPSGWTIRLHFREARGGKRFQRLPVHHKGKVRPGGARRVKLSVPRVPERISASQDQAPKCFHAHRSFLGNVVTQHWSSATSYVKNYYSNQRFLSLWIQIMNCVC